MTGAELANMYEFSYGAIKRNLEDLTNEESLVQPPGAGNCLNWVLGHVVAARNTVLKLAGSAPLAGEEITAHYSRGSNPLQPGDKAPDLATLRGILSDTQHQLVPALAGLSPEALNQPVPEPMRRPPLTGTVGDALIRLHYHEGYHNGQMGLLRRLVGREGAIK